MNEHNDERGDLILISVANFFPLVFVKLVLTFTESCYNKYLTI
jgi:hypothetical protein